MMHYRKGENIEKQLNKDELPFEDFLPKGTEFLWMHVNGGTKVNNVLTYAKNALKNGEYKNIVWSGNGGGVVKTISCAEILKRSYPLYQVTRTCYTTVEEHWKPQMEGLDEIVANRQIPSLHIFMSLEPIDDNVKGLQKPNTKTDFWVYDTNQNKPTTSLHTNRNYNYKQSTYNQNQRRPNNNQNKNQKQSGTNSSPNNQEPSAEVSSSSAVCNQQSNLKNQLKRKRANQDNLQNPSSNSMENSNKDQ